jgi:hypothetical protein
MKNKLPSVTDVPCTCGYLERATDDPENPIVYDEKTSEYHFTSGEGYLIIFHCPRCGGVAPTAQRKLLYAAIPSAEKKRLTQLLAPIETLQKAIDTFGPPQVDDFIQSRNDRRDVPNSPPTFERTRFIIYKTLSEVADVWIMENLNGPPHWMLHGKEIKE